MKNFILSYLPYDIRLCRYLMGLMLIIVSVSSNAQLRTSGKQIVDGSGTPVILNGFAPGGWLNIEGYMIQTEQNGTYPLAPSEIETAIENLIGTADKNELSTSL